MRRVLSPSAEQFLASDKGQTMIAMVGWENARLYWRYRQSVPWAQLSLVLGVAFFLSTALLHSTTDFWIVIIWFCLTTVPLTLFGLAVSWRMNWRVARSLGLPLHRALNMPIGHPELLPVWAEAHGANLIPPIESPD